MGDWSDEALGIVDLDEDVEACDDSFYLSEPYLRQLAGNEDLDAVSYMELTVDSSQTTLGELGQRIPNMQQLKLNNSILPRIRDLGTSLKNLQVLWIARSSVEDLGGLAALPLLRELYASFNDVTDIMPCAELEELQVLDLEANSVEDLDSVAYLSMCKNLTSLTLENTPLFTTPQYRRRIVEQVPQLQMLDDMPVEDGDRVAPDEAPDDAGEGGLFAGLEDLMEDPAMADLKAEMEKAQREVAMVADGIKYARPDVDDDAFLHMAMAEMGERGGEEGMVSLLAPHVTGGSPVRPGTPSVLGALPGRPGTGRPGSGASRASSSGSGGAGVPLTTPRGGMMGGFGLEQLDRPPVRPGTASLWGRSASAGGHVTRPMTAMSRPMSAARRAGSAGVMRPGTASRARPGTAGGNALGRSSSAKEAVSQDAKEAAQGLYWRKNRQQASIGGDGKGEDDDDDAAMSSLTHGSEEAFSGNATKALRARRRDGVGGLGAADSAAGSAAALSEEVAALDDHHALLEELKRWKLENAQTLLARWDEEAAAAGGEPWAGAHDPLEGGAADVLVVDCAPFTPRAGAGAGAGAGASAGAGMGSGSGSGRALGHPPAPPPPRGGELPSESPLARGRTSSARSAASSDASSPEPEPEPEKGAGIGAGTGAGSAGGDGGGGRGYPGGEVAAGRLRPKQAQAIYSQRAGAGGGAPRPEGRAHAGAGDGGEESPDSPLLLREDRDTRRIIA